MSTEQDNIISRSIVVIPSLNPDNKLKPYIEQLFDAGFKKVIVIDDGSGNDFTDIFNNIKVIGAEVLSYEINKGKGGALRTAFEYIKNNLSNYDRVVTADADGQHTVADVYRVCIENSKNPDALILGTRDFSQADVPFKSRAGNKITTSVFKLLYGQRIVDTQTGLRSFSMNYIDNMISTKGNRYEYEMNMLINFSLLKVKVIPVIIETLYENNNEGSHFHPIKDSFKIYKVIFSNVFKFISSSLITTAIDYGTFVLLISFLRSSGVDVVTRIFIAEYVARLISSLCNFLINKNFVFNIAGGNIHKRTALFRYIITCLVIITLSWIFTTLLNKFFGMNELIAKPICDSVLFLLSYYIQRNWVFVGKSQTKDLDKD